MREVHIKLYINQ